jgi:hypothetical protein
LHNKTFFLLSVCVLSIFFLLGKHFFNLCETLILRAWLPLGSILRTAALPLGSVLRINLQLR